jgi:hypothetical protein
MSPEDIRKLLGGYATGTLTTEEQQALFAAALEDQELFDALAREQSLRDLLRDPAARAELLSALDTPASRVGGFWQWLRRPLVAGLATAGVAAIALVAVWQGTRPASVKRTEPVIVAELKRPDAAPAPSVAPTAPAPPSQPAAKTRDQGAGAPATVTADKKTADAMAMPARRFEAPTQSQTAGSAGELMKEKKALAATAPSPVRQAVVGEPSNIAPAAAPAMADKQVVAMAPLPPPPPASTAIPLFAARKAETDAAPAVPQRGLAAGALQANLPLDARALFYLDQLTTGANAFVQPSGGGGTAPPVANRAVPRKDASPPMAKTASGLIAPILATAPRLGVRVSILRGENEVDLTTVLDPGETVRLKVIPNADGFLYVAEGARMVASGRAQRLQPFETPDLRFEGSGQKQLIVLLSRRPENLSPQLLLGSLARDNLVENSASRERATYIVSGPREAGAQEVVVPVTLTYR